MNNRIGLARQIGRGDRQQRTAKAIADGVDFTVQNNRLDNLDRIEHANSQVILHAQIAVFRTGVVPRNHEHRMTAVDQVTHQRVVRRQIEYVIFHDPRRHDQHRLGSDFFGRGRILDQFQQAVAEDHFAAGGRNLAARSEFVHVDWRLAALRALLVFLEITLPAQQVLTVFLHRRIEYQRIGGNEIHR